MACDLKEKELPIRQGKRREEDGQKFYKDAARSLRKYFAEKGWSDFQMTDGIENKWKKFLKINSEMIVKFVHEISDERKRKDYWLSQNYRMAIKENEETWNKLIKKRMKQCSIKGRF